MLTPFLTNSAATEIARWAERYQLSKLPASIVIWRVTCWLSVWPATINSYPTASGELRILGETLKRADGALVQVRAAGGERDVALELHHAAGGVEGDDVGVFVGEFGQARCSDRPEGRVHPFRPPVAGD